MRTLVAALLVCATSLTASGQRVADSRAGVAPASRPDSAGTDGMAVHRGPLPFHTPSAALPFAPLASAAVPGAGQAMLGNNRAVAYAAIELLAWLEYFQDRRDQNAQERAFKAIAARVARAHFTANPLDAPWAYYEQMRDFLESGVFSKSATGVVPESDITTYNGFEWDVLKRAHAGDSLAALPDYQQIAVRPEFQWSWRNAGLQWNQFKLTTGLRNDAYRRRQRDLEIVLANHVLSMIDAFTTFRLRAQPTPDGGTGLGLQLEW